MWQIIASRVENPKGNYLMNIVDQAFETQLRNIQAKTGKTLEQLVALINASGLTKHGEIRDMLKRDLGLGHGDANTLTHFYLNSSSERKPQESNTLDEIRAGDLRWP